MWRLAVSVVSVVWTAYVLSCWLRLGGETTTKDVSNFFTTLAALFGAMSCAACALRSENMGGRWRVAWALMGLGWLFIALGEGQWLVLETLERREVPELGWADLFFQLSYPLLLLGLGCFFVGARGTKSWRVLFDSALIASAFGALAWFIVLRPVWMARELNAPLGTWLAVSYPLFDVFIGWGALALARSRAYGNSQGRVMSFLAVIMGFYACSDLLYAFQEVSGTYQSGGWCDVCMGTVYVASGLCALLSLWSDHAAGSNAPTAPEPERENRWLWRVLAPYGFTIAVLGTVSVQQWRTSGRLGLDVLLWDVAFLALVLARQMLSLGDNVRLARQLRELNFDLDAQVQARTRQLDALLQLSKAVNSTLLESDVLRQAALSVRRAVHVHAAGVWLWDENHRQISPGAFDSSSHENAQTQGAPELRAWDAVLEGEAARAITQRVVSGGQSHEWCGDVQLQTEGVGGEHIAAWMHLQPVRYGERVLGVLGALRLVEARSARPFAPDETRLLENVGLEIGTALEKARTYSRAVEAADLDPNTGLLNHRAMHDRLESAWVRAQTQGAPLSVVMMDLNNFKGFNDTYGHLAGDEVLRLVAGALMRACRANDLVARYGGDEFFMLLPDTDTHDALRVAERLREAMANVEFRPTREHEALPIGLSFGVATSPRDVNSKIELLALADRNLYVAKGSRGQIHGTSEAVRQQRTLLSTDGVATLDAMVTAISNADAYTRQHSEDVTEYALWIAQELELDAATLRTIGVGGMLHDVGKICVPQDVLKKPGKLTDEEFAAMKTHPALGTLLVGAILPDTDVLDIVRSHHERFDGRGYPDALAGENIPFLGRIVAVADAFSAMTTSRPYRKALSRQQARQEIERGIGTQFDPEIAAAFLRALNQHGEE